MAAPESEVTKDQASEVETPAATEAQVPPARPPGKRRSGGVASKLVVSTLALLVALGAAGYGVLTFRHVDPRVDEVANHIDAGLVAAQGAVDKARGLLDDLTGSVKPAPKAASRHALLDKAPLTPAPAPSPAETAPPPAPPAPAEAVKEPEKPVEAPATEAKPLDLPEPAQKPVETAEEATLLPPPPAPAAAPVEMPKPAPAAKGEVPAADGFTDRDLISALEGRIEALSDEVLALRQKFEAPKSEARAAPEIEVSRAEETPKPAPAPVVVSAVDTASATVVVAFALQRDLEAGKPFGEEIAALSRLNAEPAPVLIELSEKGAPTGAQLRESLQAIAKKIEAHETHSGAPQGDLTGQLLESASKLVKVRPTGQAHPESVAGKLQHIETALGRNDFAGAESFYDSLPEEAKAESKEFGQTLHQHSEAAKAADDLLRGAIAAVGKK
ncbi:hypothetical protein OGR47_18590 [Methylocystis sp. MJC1]|jgi:hypothetical protein|uniref:COG4223 family protein n=1 Tax=Methylocystis sp. MJC1 TaxID=2654282 RepID=UPI0013EC26AF|nr:hypothetical protein [Methylocystis sp. MJC1]KAF2991864.1 hypothetical protein MJC1_00886 [Methylocystis sp. MJC1]MBU6528967.1 hypothetical protein [Methylocystis sp. MJC1]UZX11850.1 hypothetical protein OGR47_18590 [Methylocystis sp. MJC1]